MRKLISISYCISSWTEYILSNEKNTGIAVSEILNSEHWTGLCCVTCGHKGISFFFRKISIEFVLRLFLSTVWTVWMLSTSSKRLAIVYGILCRVSRIAPGRAIELLFIIANLCHSRCVTHELETNDGWISLCCRCGFTSAPTHKRWHSLSFSFPFFHFELNVIDAELIYQQSIGGHWWC